VTTHQLLTHSAGWASGSAAFGRLDDAALGDAFRAIDDTMMLSEPGRVPSYSNPSFSMAGYVAERATGRRYADLVDSLVIRRLGLPRATFRPMVAMTHDFALGHSVPPQGPARVQRPMPGNAADWPGAFLYASAAELSRMAIALMNNGETEGRRVFASDAIRLLTGAYVRIPGERILRYGYGMTVDTIAGHRVWQKNGAEPGFLALITMWPDDQFAVVVTLNSRAEIQDRITEQAARIAAGLTAPQEIAYRSERDPTPAERAALVGTYTTRQATLIVREVDGGLQIQSPNGVARPARMTSDGSRLVAGAPSDSLQLPFVIVRDDKGQPRFLYRNSRAYVRIP
jgi:CubicO group peptidase (beta-lactamase class C family)